MAQAQLPADEIGDVAGLPVIVGADGGESPAQGSQTEPVRPKRASAARYLWAALMARIYQVFCAAVSSVRRPNESDRICHRWP